MCKGGAIDKELAARDTSADQLCDTYTRGQPECNVIAKNDSFKSRTKHIDTRYHFVRDKVKENLSRSTILKRSHSGGPSHQTDFDDETRFTTG